MLKPRIIKVQNRYGDRKILQPITQETSLKGQSIRQNEANQIQEQYEYNVLQTILLDKHHHLDCSPIEILLSIFQRAYKNILNSSYEMNAILQNIKLANIFNMLVKGIQCTKCSKSFIFYLINEYPKVLKLILRSSQIRLSSLQDYSWFLKLNQVLLKQEVDRIQSLDALWYNSIKKLIKQSELNLKYENRQKKDLNEEFQDGIKNDYFNQNEETFSKCIKSQLRIYQMSVQLLKLYLNFNRKNIVNFYDTYIKHSNPNFLLTIGKLINCTYQKNKILNGTESQFQFQIVQPLIKKIESSNTGLRFCFKPQREKQIETISEKIIEISNENLQSPKKWKINKTQSKYITLQQAETIINKKKNQEKINSISISLKSVQQLSQLLSELLESENKDFKIIHGKQQILKSLKRLKIKNLKGDSQKKKQMAELLLLVSSRQPALVSSAFENGLFYFDISQFPTKIKEYYKSSPKAVKDQYEKQRKRNRSQLKILYDLYKIQ